LKNSLKSLPTRWQTPASASNNRAYQVLFWQTRASASGQSDIFNRNQSEKIIVDSISGGKNVSQTFTKPGRLETAREVAAEGIGGNTDTGCIGVFSNS